VDDLLRDRLLAFVHDRVHELGHDQVAVFGVRNDLAFLSAMPAGHGLVFSSHPDRGSGLSRCSNMTDLLRPSALFAPGAPLRSPPYDLLIADHFGRLAPYFERRCLRSLTPCVSSTPRRM